MLDNCHSANAHSDFMTMVKTIAFNANNNVKTAALIHPVDNVLAINI